MELGFEPSLILKPVSLTSKNHNSKLHFQGYSRVDHSRDHTITDIFLSSYLVDIVCLVLLGICSNLTSGLGFLQKRLNLYHCQGLAVDSQVCRTYGLLKVKPIVVLRESPVLGE